MRMRPQEGAGLEVPRAITSLRAVPAQVQSLAGPLTSLAPGPITVGKPGFLVTVPKKSHSKPFPARGYWRSEAFFFGGVGGLPLLLRFLSGLDPRGLPVFWLPFATHIYVPTITSACTYLWASPNSPQSPQLSSQPPPQPLRKALLPTWSLRLKPRCHAVAFTHPPPTSTLSPATTGLLS